MTQDSSAAGNPEPGPDNFSFEDYLEGNATFPVFTHTAYLDQRSGAELADVQDSLDVLIAEQDSVAKQIESRAGRASNSFVDSAMDELLGQREQLDDEIKGLLAQRNDLRARVRRSAVELAFRVKTPEELGSVSREATRLFHKENPQFKGVGESDLDYVTARTRYTLTAQIAHFCTGVKLSDGREVPPPTRSGADLLLTKLIASEMMRLMQAVATGLSASRDWADEIDAGFPGGGSDVEEIRLGPASAENRESLGGASTDHADRRDHGLVGRTEPEAGHGADDAGGGELQGLRDSGVDRDVHQ